jgi:carbon storage regulator
MRLEEAGERMLVLKRQVGEKLVIGNEVVIEVLAVSGDGVRIGIAAPRETSVHRFEVFEEIQAINRAAAHVTTVATPAALANLAAQLRAVEEEPAEVRDAVAA